MQIIIKGIIDDCNVDCAEDLRRKLWFEKIDQFYYSRKNCIIVLSKSDKKVISNCQDCRDKLRILSFRKNIQIIQ